MSTTIQIVKSEEELPVPRAWRQTISDIVGAFISSDFRLDKTAGRVQPISESEAKRISGNIDAYGDELISLSDENWQTSVYRYMGDYWQVLVDLAMVDESSSDLVMFIKVRENMGEYDFMVESVHVP